MRTRGKGAGHAVSLWITFLWVLCHANQAWAQDSLFYNASPWEELLDQLVVDADGEETDYQSIYEQMDELAQHPLNLNTATRAELEQLPFLSAQQIAHLQEYIYRYKRIDSWGELNLIPSLTPATCQLLMQVTCIRPPEENLFPSLSNLLKNGRSNLTLTGRIPFYRREGDRNGYQGYPYRHSVRYTFQYGQRVKLGLIAAQDAGEPFFSNRNQKGYDYYSFYLYLSKLGPVKTAVAGRYRVSLGMGLIMNSSFSPGKLATLQSLGRQQNTLRPHSSRMESTYLQGAAATVALGSHVEATAFVSHRQIDATLTANGKGIVTLLTSGYHRTESELRRKHNAAETVLGGNISYRLNGFQVGASAVSAHFSKPLEPNTRQPYRRYSPEGSQFWNASINYGYLSRRLNIAGETAIDQQGSMATVNTVSYECAQNLSVVALQRFYAYRYQAIHGSSFGESSTVNNESGFFLGAQWRASKRLSLSAYSDYVYHPWAKYQASQASHAWDNMLSATWNKGAWSLLARYRLRFKQRDNDDKTALENRVEQRTRLALSFNRGPLTLRTQMDGALVSQQQRSRGWMLSQQASYRWNSFSLSALAGYFHTDDYDSRVYVYERNLKHDFSFPMYYGRGMRYSLWARADVGRSLQLTLRIATTNYFDRNHIGSSYQQINGSSQTEADLQLNYRF